MNCIQVEKLCEHMKMNIRGKEGKSEDFIKVLESYLNDSASQIQSEEKTEDANLYALLANVNNIVTLPNIENKSEKRDVNIPDLMHVTESTSETLSIETLNLNDITQPMEDQNIPLKNTLSDSKDNTLVDENKLYVESNIEITDNKVPMEETKDSFQKHLGIYYEKNEETVKFKESANNGKDVLPVKSNEKMKEAATIIPLQQPVEEHTLKDVKINKIEDSFEKENTPMSEDKDALPFDFRKKLVETSEHMVIHKDFSLNRSGNIEASGNTEIKPYGDEVIGGVFRTIIDSISQKTVNGVHEMDIRLEPGYLGGLHIKIVKQDNEMVIKIKASNDQVKNSLDEKIAILNDSLKIQGINIKEIELTGFEQETDNSAGPFTQNNDNPDKGEYNPQKEFFQEFISSEEDKESKTKLQSYFEKGTVNILA